MIDLDAQREARAARREGASETLPVRYRGVDYHLPAELPAGVLDPLLNGQVDLTELVRLVAVAVQDADDRSAEVIVASLIKRPDLPAGLLNAVHDFLRSLFGKGWGEFWGSAPSLPDIAALVGALLREYGVGLGESFGPTGSSPADGQMPNPISNGSTPSTPDESGPDPTTPTS